MSDIYDREDNLRPKHNNYVRSLPKEMERKVPYKRDFDLLG